MISATKVQNFCQEVIEQFEPEKIILFGSYAYGTPTQDSDIDLLVVMPFECHPTEQAIEILHAIDYHFPLDLLVRTPRQLQKRLEMGDFFIREILQKGHILYETNYERVGQQGGKRLFISPVTIRSATA